MGKIALFALIAFVLGLAWNLDAHMTSIYQLLFGVALGYFILSPKFREFIKRFIVYNWNQLHPPKIEPPKKSKPSEPYWVDVTYKLANNHTPAKPTKPIHHDPSGKPLIPVEESQVEQWFKENDDLRKANEG